MSTLYSCKRTEPKGHDTVVVQSGMRLALVQEKQESASEKKHSHYHYAAIRNYCFGDVKIVAQYGFILLRTTCF